ncbi:Eco29kI family restriction endonuclease [Micromonospora sp. PSH03]|uniref:Eco29kI family restriction endonuclease n=1 Tax=Micromonospora salmantinae TaxID=2911211 RepID=UPI001EE9AA5B|nr:Eco29kI family restriction endonuclease [Micromonospora salmantinae]MCG5459775.1 Eco29kI family restriction endonuclease [Micromonospora salmantinae]
MAEQVKPYNPLDRVELGKSVERALLARPLSPLPPTAVFSGAGLYVIYYVGALELYRPIAPPARQAGEIPIYVGRASAPGARQGALGLESTTTEPALFTRLKQHAKSVQLAEAYSDEHDQHGLRLADFRCRYLVADDIWVPLAEALLIGHYRPVWNVLIDGFGNHDPGKGRGEQARSSWDMLHPGRAWAAKRPATKKSAHALRYEVTAHLSSVVPPNLDVVPVVDHDVQAAMVKEEGFTPLEEFLRRL